jgi:hypothetical protein
VPVLVKKQADWVNDWLRERLGDRLGYSHLAPNVEPIVITVHHPLWTHPWYFLRNRFHHGWRIVEWRIVGHDIFCTMVQLYRCPSREDDIS